MNESYLITRIEAQNPYKEAVANVYDDIYGLLHQYGPIEGAQYPDDETLNVSDIPLSESWRVGFSLPPDEPGLPRSPLLIWVSPRLKPDLKTCVDERYSPDDVFHLAVYQDRIYDGETEQLLQTDEVLALHNDIQTYVLPHLRQAGGFTADKPTSGET